MRRTARNIAACILLPAILSVAVGGRPAAAPEPAFLIAAERVQPVTHTNSGRPPHHTPICQRSPEAVRSLLQFMEAENCAAADPARLEQLQRDDTLSITVHRLELGDLDQMWNLGHAAVAAGDRDNPLPPGLFRDLRAVETIAITTAGDFIEGALEGLTLLRSAYLANGYNAINPPDSAPPAAIATPAMTTVQDALPESLLCPATWLARLSLWIPGFIPVTFFDCAPRLTHLETGNRTPDGHNAAQPYLLDLRALENLQFLRTPAMPGDRGPLRPALLSEHSPLYRQKTRNPQQGTDSCPRYITGESWIMCLD